MESMLFTDKAFQESAKTGGEVNQLHQLKKQLANLVKVQ